MNSLEDYEIKFFKVEFNVMVNKCYGFFMMMMDEYINFFKFF